MSKVIQIDGKAGKRARAKLLGGKRRSRKDPQQLHIEAMIRWVRKYRASIAS